MPIIDPSPSPDELKSLAAVFSTVEAGLEKYLASPAGQADARFDALTAAALSLNNAVDTIAVVQLRLATDQGLQALSVINKSTAELQKALIVRQEITRDLGIVQAVVAFGAAIASDDLGSIIESGGKLFDVLTAKN